MSQAKIYWDLDNYAQVEKVSDCYLFAHETLRSSEARLNVLLRWKCWFLRRGENRSARRKTSRSKDENQQQTQPTYDTGTGSRTQATLVGSERSHHCAIPAPL